MSMLSTCSVYRCTFLYKVTLPSTGLAWMQLLSQNHMNRDCFTKHFSVFSKLCKQTLS